MSVFPFFCTLWFFFAEGRGGRKDPVIKSSISRGPYNVEWEEKGELKLSCSRWGRNSVFAPRVRKSKEFHCLAKS